ncbi:MAG TPA: hypothetical protein VGC03_02700 [Acidimicrobiia bacterium]|jgi:hypothetical protein
MSDLTTQIREYATRLDERYPDVSPEELMERLVSRDSQPRRRWNGPLVAIAVAVLVVLLGVLTYLASSQQGSPVVDQPVRPPTVPSTSVTTQEGELATDITAASTLPTVPSDPTTMEVDGLEPAEVRTVETSLGTWTTLRYDGELADMEALFNPSFRPATFETPAFPNPGLPEVDWHEHDTSGSAVVGQVAVSTASIGGTFDWETLGSRLPSGLPGWIEGERAIEFDGGHVLDVDLVAGAVEFRRRDTGELALRLVPPDASISAQQLVGEGSRVASGRWEPEIWGLFVDNGETSGWVEPPWSGRAVDYVDGTAFGDQFVLVASVRPDWEEQNRSSIIRIWRSIDGANWTETGLSFDLDGFARDLDVQGDEDSVSLRLEDDSGARLFVSTDGAVWDGVGVEIEGGVAAGPTRVSFGWMMVVEGDDTSCHVYISRDLRSWDSLQLAPLFDPPDGANWGCSIDGDHAIALAEGSYWIGGFG